MAQENVIITDCRVEDTPPADLKSWPDGSFLLDLVRPYLEEEPTTSTAPTAAAVTTTTGEQDTFTVSSTAATSNSSTGQQDSFIRTDDPLYWQLCVQWALLQKYGYLSIEISTAEAMSSVDTPEACQDRSRDSPAAPQLTLSRQQANSITTCWNELVTSVNNMSHLTGSDNKDTDGNGGQVVVHEDDLKEFLATWRSSRNRRVLRWSVMNCAPACQFVLHAHPNIEVVYCLSGQLYGVRMQGKPLNQEFIETKDEDSTKLMGPNLSNCNQPWYFETLSQGEFLVNEVGSIHKSFTATNGTGAVLLVLWGGSHANIDETTHAPVSVNVVAAVNEMDQKVSASASTCHSCGGQGQKIQQVFLPESERTK